MSPTESNAGDTEWLEALAPAKVNPVLEVLARREDGYHELRTLMMTLELSDRLAARIDPKLPAGALELELDGPFATPDVPRDGRNLALRALARALASCAERAGRSVPGVQLRLTKAVPSQAGLGGGSSDAAAAVALGEALLCPSGESIEPQERSALLAELGSDCAFFADVAATGVGLCTGRGERVEALPSPKREWWVALITPETRCPTATVYGALGFPLSSSDDASNVRVLSGMRASEARAFCFNQLEAAALAAIPELQEWRDALDAAGAEHFVLAGSGSSFFGLFDEADAARAALEPVIHGLQRRSLAIRGRWVTRTLRHGPQVIRSGARGEGSTR